MSESARPRAHTHPPKCICYCRWEEGRVAEMKEFEKKTPKKFLQITGINVKLVIGQDHKQTEVRRWSRGGRGARYRSY